MVQKVQYHCQQKIYDIIIRNHSQRANEDNALRNLSFSFYMNDLSVSLFLQLKKQKVLTHRTWLQIATRCNGKVSYSRGYKAKYKKNTPPNQHIPFVDGVSKKGMNQSVCPHIRNIFLALIHLTNLLLPVQQLKTVLEGQRPGLVS